MIDIGDESNTWIVAGGFRPFPQFPQVVLLFPQRPPLPLNRLHGACSRAALAREAGVLEL
jgi:hypothetical protein